MCGDRGVTVSDSSKLLKRFPQLAYELNNWRCAARVLRGSDVRHE